MPGLCLEAKEPQIFHAKDHTWGLSSLLKEKGAVTSSKPGDSQQDSWNLEFLPVSCSLATFLPACG